MENTTLTFGQESVRLDFNPGANPEVNKIKQMYADIIDYCEVERQKAGVSKKGRDYSVAITQAETACMWTVRALTGK